MSIFDASLGPVVLSSDSLRTDDTTLSILGFLTAHADGDILTEAQALASLIPAPACVRDEMQHDWWQSSEAEGVACRAWDLAEDYAPDGWWFGFHPDDCTCLGYWRMPEDSE